MNLPYKIEFCATILDFQRANAALYCRINHAEWEDHPMLSVTCRMTCVKLPGATVAVDGEASEIFVVTARISPVPPGLKRLALPDGPLLSPWGAAAYYPADFSILNELYTRSEQWVKEGII